MNCFFCNEDTDGRFISVPICDDCREKNFDPAVGSGSVASKPVLHPKAEVGTRIKSE